MSAIIYDYPFMDDLKAGYDNCALISQDIMDKLTAMHDELQANYDGQAIAVASDVLLKIKEHMHLLETYSLGAASFVAQSKGRMQAADDDLALHSFSLIF